MKFSTNLIVVLLATIPIACASAGPTDLDHTEARMSAWVDANAPGAISLLEETVNIGSGTMNHDGVREVGRIMRRELGALGEGGHTPNESLDLTSMPTAIKRAALLIYRLGQESQRD